MKRKMLMSMAILCIAITVANARPGYPAKNITAKASTVISAFMDAHVNGDAALLNAILNGNAQLKLNKQDNIITQFKSDLVAFSKKVGPLTLNCSSNYEILSSSDCVVMARVDFKFPEFVQQNYITIEKDKKGSWKITQINRFHS